MADPGEPVVLLLLPRTLEEFILRDQAEDLLRAPGVVALEPGRVRYGVFGRLPRPLGDFLARGTARRLRLPGELKAVVVFHPFQYPLAGAIIARHPGCELWYSRWDRYERAYDAGPRLRERLEELHAEAAERAALTFAVSTRLAELERKEGREALLVPSSADRFPAPDPSAAIVAVSLGHLGRRTDWGILRAVGEAMSELVVLLVGEWHADESGADPDFQACRALPNLVWLGPAPTRRRLGSSSAPTSGLRPSRPPSSTTPGCRTGSSSTRARAGARSRPSSRACASGTAP